jgi:hypothetical protein
LQLFPPYFTFRGEYHLERWYNGTFPEDYHVNTSVKGYISDDIAFDWVQHFHEHKKDRISKPNPPRLLLMDGHGSHLTYNFLQCCGSHYIIPFVFFRHTTHLVQPLDGQPFLVYKHYCRKNNTRFARLGIPVTDKR